VIFALVDAEKAHYPTNVLCRTLGVSPAGFYAWRKRPPSEHARADQRLRVQIREAHERSRRTYGSPRVHAELADHDVCVSRKRVARLMREEQLVARRRKRFKCTTMSDHDQPVAANLLGGSTSPKPRARTSGNRGVARGWTVGFFAVGA